ncbi:hypothetical protein ATANTOWER_019566 [Ataeniobius toweri]|uniref:Uncharacterized protein n=1 Tax=Ataeniobius toweri TaxID=208326 RepID=A0ABU7BAI9_9TELE|nr:hypothetical protein [Ataeniobius toweri]
MQCALQRHNYSGNTRREHQPRKPRATSPAKLNRCGKDLPPPTNLNPPSTCQSRSIQRIQSEFNLALHISQINC